MMTTRRFFLFSGTALLASAGLGRFASNSFAAATETFEVTKTEAEWKAILTEDQFRILRQQDTERPFTSALNTEKRKGIFQCAGCDLPVYASETKFDSGTGWPSFWEAIEGGIGTVEDTSLFMTRVECHCRRCGGHFGHIFDDGPQPTGKRHCINGLALKFVPATAA